jgi:hypothetical protein
VVQTFGLLELLRLVARKLQGKNRLNSEFNLKNLNEFSTPDEALIRLEKDVKNFNYESITLTQIQLESLYQEIKGFDRKGFFHRNMI